MEYTTNKDLKEFSDGDSTVIFYGYIFSVETAKVVGKMIKYKLLKFVVTNGSMKLTCLLWGDELIEKFQKDLIIDNKIMIDGGRLKECKTYIKDNSFVDLELNIQKHTDITFHGKHKPEGAEECPIEEVDFISISNAVGLIKISGFVRTKFAQAFLRNNLSTYACGSITDGEYKITVNVTTYEEHSIERGDKVSIVGRANYSVTGSLILQVDNFSDIQVLADFPRMPLSDLCRGVKTPKRKLDDDHGKEDGE